MAQDPNQQPGNEARADDLPMNPQPTQQELDVAAQQYIQMKQGMDNRINVYSVTRNQLMSKTVRNLEKWTKDNCESVYKLLGQKSNKAQKVDLLLTAIEKQRILDLKLLKTCRDNAITLGVPANKLPWNYGELDAVNGNGNVNGNNGNNQNINQDFQNRINKLYSDLENLQRQHGMQGNGNNNNGNNNNGNVNRGNGNSGSANNGNSGNAHNGNAAAEAKDNGGDQPLDPAAQALKQQIVSHLHGLRTRVPAKNVSSLRV